MSVWRPPSSTHRRWKHLLVRLTLDLDRDGHPAHTCLRRFGEVGLVEDPEGGIRHRGAVEGRADPARMPRRWLLPRREEWRACPRCPGRIQRIQVAGRLTRFCPGHRPEP